ncbi:hypothetical protein V8E36_003516 [Tilletia maclaganii]
MVDDGDEDDDNDLFSDSEDEDPQPPGNGDGGNGLNAAGQAAAAAVLLTANLLIWRHRYICDHAGRPQNKPKNGNLSPDKRRKRLPSIKVGCKAQFNASRPIVEDRVYVKWIFEHTGHDIASLRSVAESRLPHRIRDWLRVRVEEGRDWRAIRNLLRLEDDQLQQLEDMDGPLDKIPEALRIKQMDVYDEIRRQVLRAARKGDTREFSLQNWAEEVRAEGGVADVKLDIPCAESENTWAAYFLSAWQIEMLLAHGNDTIICLDATHNTSRHSSGIHADEWRARSAHHHDRLLHNRAQCDTDGVSRSKHNSRLLLRLAYAQSGV